ncbi:endonuclease III [Spirochaetia bacterium]|nr:endonuclease III [Spirochaetia bacterium]
MKNNSKIENNAIKWDEIIEILENRQKNPDGNADKAPSVSTIAEVFNHNPWPVLLSTILSLRTKDEVTLPASGRLLEKAPTPARLLETDSRLAEKLIYPVGFYRNKIANLKKIAAILIDQYEGAVPRTMEGLLALPGVGRKTANLVLIEAFGLDGICVDTHVHRISNRAGWVSTKTPDDTEMALREILPLKFWKRFNGLLVLYGQNTCRPVSPFCSKCTLVSHCARINLSTTR